MIMLLPRQARVLHLDSGVHEDVQQVKFRVFRTVDGSRKGQRKMRQSNIYVLFKLLLYDSSPAS